MTERGEALRSGRILVVEDSLGCYRRTWKRPATR